MREEATDAELAQLVAEWRRDTLARKQLGAAELIAQERAMSPKWSDAELGPWAEAKQLVSPHTLEIVRTPGTQWYTLVDQIACPILLITADPAQGAIVTPAGAATSGRALARRPGGQHRRRRALHPARPAGAVYARAGRVPGHAAPARVALN